MKQWLHGETTTDRQRAGGQGAARGKPCHRFGPTSRGPSGTAAGRGIGDAGANGGHLGGWSGERPTIAAALPPVGASAGDAPALGRAAQGAAQCGGRSAVLGAVGRAGQGGRSVGVVADPRRTGATLGARPVAASVLWRLLARHGWRKVAPDTRHPKSDPLAQEAWKKNSPKYWRPS